MDNRQGPLHSCAMRDPQPLTAARMAALLIFATAMISLRAQFDVSQALMGQASVADTLWRMAGYFTILTNVLVAIVMAALAWNWRIPAQIAAGVLLPILLVFLIYHLLLARLWHPQGMAWWADHCDAMRNNFKSL